MENPKSSNANNATKKTNPQTKANIISKIFFLWTVPFFAKGCRKEINDDDLYLVVPEHESKMLTDKLENAWHNEIETKSNPSFTKILFQVFGCEYAKLGILNFLAEVLAQLIHPVLFGKLMLYYKPDQTEMSTQDALICAWLIVVVRAFDTFVVHNYMYGIVRIAMKIRLSISSLIYRKSLKLNRKALAETSSGQIITLLSNDVHKFQMATHFLHDFWSAPLLTIIIAYLLYSTLGCTSLCGLLVFICFLPLRFYMAKCSSKYRRSTALNSDARVKLMSEIISGIQVIKMYVWEKPFAQLVKLSRKREVDEIRKAQFVKAINLSLNIFMGNLGIFTCIIVYVLTGNVIQAQYVYVLSSYYGLLMHSFVRFLTHAFTIIAEVKVAIERITKYLKSDEVEQESLKEKFEINGKQTFTNGDLIKTPSVGIVLRDVTAKWTDEATEATLTSINFSVAENQLVAIIGTVGSGKSSLLQLILNEMNVQHGVVEVNGIISYASQDPWLFGASIRQNILFGEEYNATRYQEVIKVCALEHDLSVFEYGDKTIVGERGVMLSGGQKARINLARAVYKQADIYLLDDPLSAVDTHVGKQLFEQCITGFLKNKCTILVTHQLQYMQGVQKIYLMENGTLTRSGTFRELLNVRSKNQYLKRLESDPLEGRIYTTSESKDNKNEEKSIENANEPEEEKEHQSQGKVAGKVYISYFKATGYISLVASVALLFIITQLLVSGCDYFLSLWMNIEQKRLENYNFTVDSNKTITQRNFLVEYLYDMVDTEICLYVYSTFIIFMIVFSITRSLSFFKLCASASQNLHNNMFSKIVYNSMRFFNTNASGRILNRFSKDMGMIDEHLPQTILDTVQILLVVSGIISVICIVNIWLIIPTIIIFVIFYFFRYVYMNCSRSLKRMESTRRSPIFTHLAATLQGLTTIRAFKAEQNLSREFDNYQNYHSSAFFMYISTNRFFAFWLDTVAVIYMAVVTLSFLYTDTERYGGTVGLAITQSISLMGLLQWGVRQWSELENEMTSVERVLEYTELVTEQDNNNNEPPKDWPSEGLVEFRSVSMQYAPEEPFVLKNLSFQIKPKEKIGIVGRTGAGKSSLIFALFRLAKINGSVIIDGIDTKTITLEKARSKISIIPQEPVLFSGTLRKNLDPFDEYQDEVLWQALEEVKLKQYVEEMPLGLQSAVSESGTNFSVGQRQLVCLARAVVRNNKILVLDEATANVDPQTDELIQTTIRKKFKDCTVLTIAHRLHTVMDSDKILVMNDGQAVEFDHPYFLLQNKSSAFFKLVEHTGKGMAENLVKLAKKSLETNPVSK